MNKKEEKLEKKTKKEKKEKKEKKRKNKEDKRDKFDIISCGGVVYFKKEGETVFLILKHKNGNHWDLPKGHIKKKESFEEGAIREILEETGISSTKLRLIAPLEHKNIYITKKRLRKKNTKIVHLFLFESLTKDIKLSNEHTKFKWLNLEGIQKKLTFPTSFPAFMESFNIVNKTNFNSNSDAF